MARLLVVEDEPRLMTMLVRVLEHEGHTVLLAATGPDGVRMACEHEVDVVVLDLMLPGFDGFEVLTQVLAHDPDQQILVLSAVGDISSRVRCLEMGAADFLAKPFASAELVARIGVRLKAGAPVRPQRWLRVGGVVLDSERMSLTSAGRQVALSQRENVLLAHLMRKAGEVCTRDELLSDVWGYEAFDPGSNVVDVYVRRIRSKLQTQLIETVRNVGYSFIAS